jgi:hypothetical protein
MSVHPRKRDEDFYTSKIIVLIGTEGKQEYKIIKKTADDYFKSCKFGMLCNKGKLVIFLWLGRLCFKIAAFYCTLL